VNDIEMNMKSLSHERVPRRNNKPTLQPVHLFFPLSTALPSIVAGCSVLLCHSLVSQTLHLYFQAVWYSGYVEIKEKYENLFVIHVGTWNLKRSKIALRKNPVVVDFEEIAFMSG